MADKKNIQNKIKFDVSETDKTIFQEKLKKAGSRLLNPDGTFNIEREGKTAANMYERIVNLSWTKIIFSFLLFYFLANAFFALIFLAIGTDSINGMEHGSTVDNYFGMLFFSIQTFTTVGYGHLNPVGPAANLLASIVAFVGLITFALLTGLSFTKFSKPQAHIVFSEMILLGPNPLNKNKPSIQFRIVNTSKNQLIDMEARVTLTWLVKVNGLWKRKFERLDLEFESIHLFPLNWTIIHSINHGSPLYGLTLNQMVERHMELLVLVKGFDDTYSQKIHSKRSYSFADLVEGAAFVSMYDIGKDKTVLNLSKIDEYLPYDFDA